MRPPSLKSLMAQCQNFNQRVPVGSEVWYHPVIGEANAAKYVTKTEAYILSGHTAVVHLDGRSGCVCIAAVTIEWNTRQENW